MLYVYNAYLALVVNVPSALPLSQVDMKSGPSCPVPITVVLIPVNNKDPVNKLTSYHYFGAV